MLNLGKRNVAGALIDAIDYDGATAQILAAANERRSFAGTALAVHGVVTAGSDREFAGAVNSLDLVTPDGQPVRWAMNRLHGTGLRDRVHGPTLMRQICEAAAARGLSIFLYGSTLTTLAQLDRGLKELVPGLRIAGTQPSLFRLAGVQERDDIASQIAASGASIVFVGTGCPRQEILALDLRQRVNAPVLAVGAAFDYFAGHLKLPPPWMQRAGLEWAYRLAQEPRRLWRRYVLLNPIFIFRVLRQRLFGAPAVDATRPTATEIAA
jgi:N-acetylglucosaminyldiphosphoundecaprenol N-acetyl-beta-D-mannosaminyltransferase